MSFPLSSQLLLDDDADMDDADDFDLDFDEDYENMSDEEFEVTIEYDEYDSDDADVLGIELCLDESLDDFDPFEDVLAEKDYVDEE
jgi:hypothetical protein